jgi:hypothetical protein
LPPPPIVVLPEALPPPPFTVPPDAPAAPPTGDEKSVEDDPQPAK